MNINDDIRNKRKKGRQMKNLYQQIAYTSASIGSDSCFVV